MGTVQIKLHQIRTHDPAGYQIENTIMTGPDETEGISPELFVFSYVDGDNDTYQHVATVEDIDALPERGDVGWNIYGQFFRQDTATLVYSNLTAAEEQAAIIKLRLQELAVEYDADVEAYDVTTNYTYKSSDNYVSIGLRQVGTQPGDELFRMVSTFPAATPPAVNPRSRRKGAEPRIAATNSGSSRSKSRHPSASTNELHIISLNSRSEMSAQCLMNINP